MNINKLQSQLQRVPDQALIGYVQNPDGQVPSFLALAELTRRKDIRNAGQAQQAPTQTVAQQAVAEAAPGIAQLPLPETMFNEESYANGGIVSFNEGGDVKRFAAGGPPFVELTDAQILKLTPAQLTEYNNARYAANQQGLIRGAKSFGAAGLDIISMPSRAIYNVGSDLNSLAGEGVNSLVGRQVIDTAPGKYYTTLTPFYDKYIGSNPATAPLYNPEDVRQAAAARITAAEMANRPVPVEQANVAPAEVVGTQQPPAATRAMNPSAPGAAPIRQPQGIEQLTFDPIKDRSGEFEYTPDVNARTAMDEYRGLVGANPFQAKAAEKLASMEAANAKYGEQMPWMALAEAGLGMAAGKSPFALSNIAEGGMKGVAAYKAGQDKLRETEDKIFDAQAKVAEAQRAEDIAAAKYGVDSSQAAKASKQREKAQVFEYKTNLEANNAAGKLKAKEFNLTQKFDYDKLAQQERAANNRLDIQLKAAEKRAVTEDQKLEIASIRSAISSAQANLISARKSYSDLVKSGMAAGPDIEDAKTDLQSAQQSLEYYQSLANQNIGNDGAALPKLSEKAMKYLK